VNMNATRRFARGVAHPMVWLREVCGGEAAFPLVVLFGLNAVDELDRTAFGILLPEIREYFGIDVSTVLGLVALASIASLALQVPIAQFADRSNRVRLAMIGALVWACFSGLTGLATGLIMLTVARSGSALGKAVIDPTHNSLIADLYPIEARSRVFAVHRAANAVGAFVGPLSAGLLAYAFGWRVPFIIFMVPTIVFAVLALRLQEPKRGRWERAAMGADAEVVETEEITPSFAESWRTVHKVDSLRRIWYSLPFLATALIGFVTLASLFYDQEFGLDERARGVAAAVAEPFQLVGIVFGARIASRRYANDVKGLIRFLSTVAVLSSLASAGFALSPNIVVAVAFNCLVSGMLALLTPGIFAALSLAIPPRARATGFSVASLWVIPGLAILPLIGWIADTWSIRVGMLVMLPMFVIGSLILRSVATVIEGDILQVWQATATRAELLYQRRQGESALLLVRGVEAGYGDRRVLHGIDLELVEGEIVALLGTNGAGKSTLLKAISGVVEADRGAIVFDGREITHAPPNEIARMGISQMPGGQGVFGSLTVRENLQLAGWTQRREVDAVRAATADVLEMFPVLEQRLDDAAANLSGGQQQMLALGMSFIARPRVLLIDELSLGLAPVVVGQLLPIIERLARDGTTVVLVEQSVNVALTVARRAYFMERGEIRFSGPTADLLARPDLLRSVFLAGSQENGDGSPPTQPAGVSAAGLSGASDSGDSVDVSDVSDAAVAVLRVSELAVAFGGIRAVDGVSFEIAAGEIVGVIGPNGAGKTTIFDLISGFTPSDTGRIALNGTDVTALGPSGRHARGLGRSFQDARLFPELTVSETLTVALERWMTSRSAVAAALHLPGVFESESRAALRVSELLELMGLEPYANSFVRELSTGTRRVVDLACQVAHRPSVILLDEPSAGIAQSEVEALAPVVRRLRDDMGASLVIVEHDIPFISQVSDRLLALDQGRVIATGRPDEVLSHPDVVESYLGTSGAAIARSGERG
jgi:ABC-type branched-subunit amino acid transport system ATPase component/predicted MFS family arabinose efflux permease